MDGNQNKQENESDSGDEFYNPNYNGNGWDYELEAEYLRDAERNSKLLDLLVEQWGPAMGLRALLKKNYPAYPDYDVNNINLLQYFDKQSGVPYPFPVGCIFNDNDRHWKNDGGMFSRWLTLDTLPDPDYDPYRVMALCMTAKWDLSLYCPYYHKHVGIDREDQVETVSVFNVDTGEQSQEDVIPPAVLSMLPAAHIWEGLYPKKVIENQKHAERHKQIVHKQQVELDRYRVIAESEARERALRLHEEVSTGKEVSRIVYGLPQPIYMPAWIANALPSSIDLTRKKAGRTVQNSPWVVQNTPPRSLVARMPEPMSESPETPRCKLFEDSEKKATRRYKYVGMTASSKKTRHTETTSSPSYDSDDNKKPAAKRDDDSVSSVSSESETDDGEDNSKSGSDVSDESHFSQDY